MHFFRRLVFVAALTSCSSAQGQMLVYFGTYTGAKSKGIYVSRLDTSGRLTEPELAAETVNPSFLAVHPSGRFLYAVNEVDQLEGEASGSASGFAIDAASGRLRFLSQSSSKGSGPCYLSLDRTGRHPPRGFGIDPSGAYLLAANQDSDSIVVFRIDPGNGRLTPNGQTGEVGSPVAVAFVAY